MAYLFEINEKVAFPTAETLAISPFKEIWERDNTKGKTFALEDFAYIEFMVSFMKSNPYRQYPEDRKHQVIKDDIITRTDWDIDELIVRAMEKIKDFQTNASTTYNYYLAAKTAAENMQTFFMEVNITEKNEKGTPIYKPRDITAALIDTEKVLGNLKALEKKVEEELYEEVRNRSAKKISPFAEPNSLGQGH